MEHIKDILKRWWTTFKKDHLIDEVHPDKPFLKGDIEIDKDNFEDDYDNQPFAD
jgi:hypothetical protein